MSKMKSNKSIVAARISVGICGILFLLSLVPIALVAPYVRSTGDDLNYSMNVHHVLENGGGLFDVIQTIIAGVKGTWYSWQGTWSSVALFMVQPGIWGNEWYPVTILIALLCILGGTWYLLHVIMRLLGIRRSGRWIIAFLLGMVMIQYMPNVKCGIFWWTSVAHYIIAYGMTMLCMGWALRWLETGRIRYLAGMLIGMTYLGGAGYPEVVLGAVWFVIVIMAVIERTIRQPENELNRELHEEWSHASNVEMRRRALWLIVPWVLEIAGFAVSAVAPGNKNRGGEGFGFSMQRVVSTLIGCVSDGILGILQDLIRVRVYLLLVLLIIALVYIYYDKNRAVIHMYHPVLWTLAGIFMICIVHAPARYAGTDVSGGVPDSYWMIALTIVILILAGWTIWFKETVVHRCESLRPLRWLQQEFSALIILIAVLGLCLIGYRHIVGGTVDYVCLEYRNSGALADYHTQMEEWLDLLEDPELDNVVLPMMNDEQGPFMLMVPLETDGNWSNLVYEGYYGKTSVVCIPRDQYSSEMNGR